MTLFKSDLISHLCGLLIDPAMKTGSPGKVLFSRLEIPSSALAAILPPSPENESCFFTGLSMLVTLRAFHPVNQFTMHNLRVSSLVFK